MNRLLKQYVTLRVVRAKVRGLRKGQSMTEYVLIVTAVAVAVYATYITMGTDLSKLVTSISTQLSATGG